MIEYITQNKFVRRKVEVPDKVVYRVLGEDDKAVLVDCSVLFSDGIHHSLTTWWDKESVFFCDNAGRTLTATAKPN